MKSRLQLSQSQSRHLSDVNAPTQTPQTQTQTSQTRLPPRRVSMSSRRGIHVHPSMSPTQLQPIEEDQCRRVVFDKYQDEREDRYIEELDKEVEVEYYDDDDEDEEDDYEDEEEESSIENDNGNGNGIRNRRMNNRFSSERPLSNFSTVMKSLT